MLDFTRKLSAESAIRFGARRIIKGDNPITLTLRSGERFELRSERTAENNRDYGVAYEIFVERFYDDGGYLVPDHVLNIVDLGANIGLSLLYFLHRYPSCHIIAYEPHPGLAAQAERNLLLDGTRNRVELHVKAAGAATRPMYLTNSGMGSSLTATESSATVAIEIEDIFPRLLGRRIDILKMDIEGGEYEIVDDYRFEQLNINNIVMEWHSRGGKVNDKLWCEGKLQNLGFNISTIFENCDCGMFWARK